MIVFYISGHGFGHAARDIEVINALAALRPDFPIGIRSAVPRWLLDLTLARPLRVETVECDPGMAQIDSLHLDVPRTIERAAAFYGRFDALADAEARALAEAGASMVVADIPPLAFEAAARAELPAIALGNFTWDWIYASYPEWLAGAPHLVPTIRKAYAQASLALRLPMNGGFEVFAGVVRDVPLIARHATRDRPETRAALGIPRDRPAVLISFGGYGLRGLSLDEIDALAHYTIVTVGDPQRLRLERGAERPDSAHGDRYFQRASENCLIDLDESSMYSDGFRYEDLVAAVDVVATKPGYGIVSECIANGTAMLFTSRGRFIEYDVLVAAMPRWLRCRFIPHDDLFAGRWADHLDKLLAQPPPPEHPRTDGAPVVAATLAEYA